MRGCQLWSWLAAMNIIEVNHMLIISEDMNGSISSWCSKGGHQALFGSEHFSENYSPFYHIWHAERHWNDDQ